MSDSAREFEVLMQAVIDGAATEVQQARLRELLRADAGLRAEFRLQMQMHGLLAWQHGAKDRAATRPKPVARVEASNVIQFPRWRPALAIAASVALIASLSIWMAVRSSRGGIGMEVVASTGLPKFVAGEKHTLKRLKIESGVLSFRLDSGALVEAMGPADIEFLDPMRLRVVRGNVTTDVGDKAKGFVIETANARVVDLGTRFGVNVGGSKGTDVVVFEGKVEVFKPVKSGPARSLMASLTEGDAVRIGSSARPERLVSIPVRRHSAALGSELNSSVVSDVTDNVNEAGFHRFYGIMAGGMDEGAQMYTTIGAARWHAAEGSAFPDELRGADLVQTFHDDRDRWDFQISLKVLRTSAIYVMYDSRNPIPDWLRASFTDTGLRLRSGPWRPVGIVEGIPADANGHVYVTYSVWKKEVSQASTIELNSPRVPLQPGNRAMYGIAVKPL